MKRSSGILGIEAASRLSRSKVVKWASASFMKSGFEITLPARQIATVRVLSVFGDSETNEGSVCELTSGTLDAGALATLYVAEPARGGTP